VLTGIAAAVRIRVAFRRERIHQESSVPSRSHPRSPFTVRRVRPGGLVALALIAGLLAVGPERNAHAAGANIALGSKATASSVENVGTPASAAVDGDLSTRWSSAWSDPQWLQLDLGANADISGFTIN